MGFKGVLRKTKNNMAIDGVDLIGYMYAVLTNNIQPLKTS